MRRSRVRLLLALTLTLISMLTMVERRWDEEDRQHQHPPAPGAPLVAPVPMT
jgi:hypothetical protein